MDLFTFADELEKEIRRQGADIQEIGREVIRKNNGVCLDALILRGKDRTIAPAVYLEQMFDLYMKGASIQKLGAHAVRAFQAAAGKPLRDLDSFFDDYARYRDNIYCRLVNREKNRILLENLCSEEWMDLAVTYYCKVESDQQGCGSIQIRREFPDRWGVEEGRIREDAWRNTMRDIPPYLQPLDAAMREMGWSGPMPASGTRLYLLSNRERFMGAVSIACPGETELLSEELGGSYYVIPSSIHECLVLPDDSLYSPEELGRMIREINRTEVAPEEILADHAYYYEAAEKRLREC